MKLLSSVSLPLNRFAFWGQDRAVDIKVAICSQGYSLSPREQVHPAKNRLSVSERRAALRQKKISGTKSRCKQIFTATLIQYYVFSDLSNGFLKSDWILSPLSVSEPLLFLTITALSTRTPPPTTVTADGRLQTLRSIAASSGLGRLPTGTFDAE